HARPPLVRFTDSSDSRKGRRCWENPDVRVYSIALERRKSDIDHPVLTTCPVALSHLSLAEPSPFWPIRVVKASRTSSPSALWQVFLVTTMSAPKRSTTE